MIFEIRLRQHSSFINFQSDQKGSGLRATDLKPRIDKYLGGTKRYQLTITSNEYDRREKGNEPYFGDYTLCLYDSIILHFNTYFDEELKNEIQQVLPQVFAFENFGSASSKGYGCFSPENQTREEFETLLKGKNKDVYYWDTGNVDDSDIFFQIKHFYSLLKSGINVNGTYYKSLLMTYFKDKHHDPAVSIRWEKRGIKKKAALTKNKHSTYLDDGIGSIPGKETYCAIKPLFGYSESQEWQSYDLKDHNKIKVEFPPGDEIERIISPLFFKVFKEENNVRIYYMLKNEEAVVKKILPNKKITFHVWAKEHEFFTPNKFDYGRFLNYVRENIPPKNNTQGNLPRRIDNLIGRLSNGGIKKL